MANKTTNFHRMVEVLGTHSSGWSLNALASELKVGVRTVKRYLSDLRHLGYPLQDLREAANRESRFLLPKKKIPVQVMTSLEKIRGELDSWGNPKFSKQLNKLSQLLQEWEDGKMHRGLLADGMGVELDSATYYVDHGPFSEVKVSAERLRVLEKAIEKGMKLKLTYSSYRQEKEEFDFYPYLIALRVGTLYLIGRQRENEGPFKSLRVKRILRCTTTSESFNPAPFDANQYYKYCFGQFPRQADEKPVLVKLEIRADWVKKFLSESHFNPPGKFIEKGGRLFFEMQLVVKPDFINWVFSLLPDILPHSPPSLVRSVRKKLSAGESALIKN